MQLDPLSTRPARPVWRAAARGPASPPPGSAPGAARASFHGRAALPSSCTSARSARSPRPRPGRSVRQRISLHVVYAALLEQGRHHRVVRCHGRLRSGQSVEGFAGQSRRERLEIGQGRVLYQEALLFRPEPALRDRVAAQAEVPSDLPLCLAEPEPPKSLANVEHTCFPSTYPRTFPRPDRTKLRRIAGRRTQGKGSRAPRPEACARHRGTWRACLASETTPRVAQINRPRVALEPGPDWLSMGWPLIALVGADRRSALTVPDRKERGVWPEIHRCVLNHLGRQRSHPSIRDHP